MLIVWAVPGRGRRLPSHRRVRVSPSFGAVSHPARSSGGELFPGVGVGVRPRSPQPPPLARSLARSLPPPRRVLAYSTSIERREPRSERRGWGPKRGADRRWRGSVCRATGRSLVSRSVRALRSTRPLSTHPPRDRHDTRRYPPIRSSSRDTRSVLAVPLSPSRPSLPLWPSVHRSPSPSRSGGFDRCFSVVVLATATVAFRDGRAASSVFDNVRASPFR